MVIEHALDIRHQPAQIGAEAGCENDGVEFFGACIGEYHTVGREAIDTAAHLDRAIPDFGERADVDQRYASILFNHLTRSLRGTPEAELLEIAHRQPQHRRVDEIDETRGQPPVQDRPRQNRKAEQIARYDLHRTANGQCDIDAGIGEIKRDLAAGIAEADDEHALAGIRLGISIAAAVDDRAGINIKSRPGRTVGCVRNTRRHHHDRRRNRIKWRVGKPSRTVAPQA